MSRYDVQEEQEILLGLHRLEYFLVPEKWSNLNNTRLINGTWKQLKFIDQNTNKLHAAMESLPKDKGGIYIFVIKVPVIHGITEFPVYIGRAKVTDSHSLWHRCRRYFLKYNNETERPKIAKMIRRWGPYLYLKYKTMPNNLDTTNVEKELVEALLPPMNDDYFEQTTRDGIKAFG